jgi:L-aspartate oxidase
VEVSELRSEVDFQDHLDVLIIGSGIAGLSAAVALAGRREVAVLAKESGGGGSTELAQGGIAAAVGPGDGPAAHAADTLAAAAGLGDPEVVAAVTDAAPMAVATLVDLGVRFDPGALAREGGHSFARVLHARGDATGAEISFALLGAARERGVPVIAGAFLVDLLTAPDRRRVIGAEIWDHRAAQLRHIYAKTVLLATGGYGQLWSSTTSPLACSGDGLAAALRAGAQAADLEFVQFHPTGMLVGRDPRPLASEALRGAGARLRDAGGEYLHGSGTRWPRGGDLAPRDVVSRSMARRMAELGVDHCFLDATPLGRDVLAGHFPTFVSYCQAAGLDPEHDWVPVSPTAHYTMGGVLTDYDGRTTLEGLMAVGEVGCSGLHGANRLASNSLLEGAVIGGRAVEVLLRSKGPVAPTEAVDLDETLPVHPERPIAERPAPERPAARRSALRSAMQSRAGVARAAAGLEELASRLASDFPLLRPPAGSATPEDWELANMALIARAVVGLAARREESRGAHWRTDYPADDPQWRLRQVVSLLPGGSLGVGHIDVEAGPRPVAGAAAPGVPASLAAAAV